MNGLWADVYSDPRSDDKRLALAAALGDEPRGEFVRLQFARAEGRPFDARREAALIKKHAAAWIGKLAPVTLRSSLVFEKGFLSAATFHGKKDADVEAAVGAPEWASVRVLDRSGFRAIPASLVVDPVMRSLLAIGVRLQSVPGPNRAVRPVVRMSPDDALDPISPREAAPLFDGPLLRPLVALRIYRPTEEALSDETAASLAGARALPDLRHIELALNGPPALYRWFIGSSLAKQVDIAIFDLNNLKVERPLADWVTELDDLPPVVRFVQCGFALRLSRDADESWSILDVSFRPNASYPKALPQNLVWLLQGLPRDALTGFRLREPLGDPARLLTELDTHTRLRFREVPNSGG